MPNTKIHTTEIAKELLAKNILDESTYSLQDLFRIRDACITLARYGLGDRDLLNEVLTYIGQKIGE